MPEYKPKFEAEWPIIVSVAREYKLEEDEIITLLAMREAESGPEGNEFGEMPAKGTDLITQAKWAAGGIRANKKRYNQLLQEGEYKGSRRTVRLKDFDEPPSFIRFMGQYGAPTGMGRTPIHGDELTKEHVEINKPWPGNMEKISKQIGKYFLTRKGVE